MVAERQEQLTQLHADYARWNRTGWDLADLAARMTAYHSG
jgi:hypothetical protein